MSERQLALTLEDIASLVTILRRNGYEVKARGYDAAPAVDAVSLTRREVEVLEHLRRHGTAKEAARELGISVHTVNRHRENICGRLGLAGRMDAICWACTRGLLDIFDPSE